MKSIRTVSLLVVALGLLVIPATVFGATNSNVTQSIAAGTLTADIMDASRNPVASPTVAMNAANFSFDCQTVTGTLGTDAQRLYVMNPSAASTSWSLSIAATGGADAKWQNTGATKTYEYNDASGGGCTNGQLTIDPSSAVVTADCTSTACNSATISKGDSTAMTGSTGVTLMSGNSSASVWRGYLKSIGLSQKIPAEQPADSYSLGMTLTITGS
jgi:hypothetical protein